MPFYETTILVRQDASAQQVEKLGDELKKAVEDNEGKVTKTENWGLRQLAYRVKKYRKAHYLHLNIDGPSKSVQEMEGRMRYNDDVLRYLTVRVDELSSEPSPVLQTRGGRERRR